MKYFIQFALFAICIALGSGASLKDVETAQTLAGDISEVHFRLHTIHNPEEYDEIFVGSQESLINSHYLTGKKLKILIHGFGGAVNHDFPWLTYQKYMEVDPEQNFILVDWATLAASPNYVAAFQNTQLASRAIANLIEFLIREDAVAREDVHVIGFSLGAQVAGQVGSRVNEKLTRITALDPAGVFFGGADLHNRTDPSDAHFVDVIHTNGVIQGYFEPCGTVDWYPNGGKIQPGCGLDPVGSCAHQRAHEYLVEGLDSPIPFRGVKCDNWSDFQDGLCEGNEEAIMGHYTPFNTTGTFFLTTNGEQPFAQG